ncbi:MAG: hypothetical protein R3C49_16140 [Planctomycetaceae bacterium]
MENDDFRLASRITVRDSAIENWTAPRLTGHIVEIRDVHLRGGEGYRLWSEITESARRHGLVMDSDKSGSPGKLCVVCSSRSEEWL